MGAWELLVLLCVQKELLECWLLHPGTQGAATERPMTNYICESDELTRRRNSKQHTNTLCHKQSTLFFWGVRTKSTISVTGEQSITTENNLKII
jgi:hypothetical protein